METNGAGDEAAMCKRANSRDRTAAEIREAERAADELEEMIKEADRVLAIHEAEKAANEFNDVIGEADRVLATHEAEKAADEFDDVIGEADRVLAIHEAEKAADELDAELERAEAVLLDHEERKKLREEAEEKRKNASSSSPFSINFVAVTAEDKRSKLVDDLINEWTTKVVPILDGEYQLKASAKKGEGHELEKHDDNDESSDDEWESAWPLEGFWVYQHSDDYGPDSRECKLSRWYSTQVLELGRHKQHTKKTKFVNGVLPEKYQRRAEILRELDGPDSDKLGNKHTM